MDSIPKALVDPIVPEAYRTVMIFRHFLEPATGCASYVFG
jgi:hypothetical protein